MIQQMLARIGGSRLVLLLALIALGFAVGIALRQRGTGAGDADTGSQTAANDPLSALEARTREATGDASAWAALGQGYFDSGRFADAVRAFERAARLAPQTAMFRSSLGEARVMASEHDPMPDAARKDFEDALSLDPKDPRARYFMAVARDLAGDHAGAIDDWVALLADTPAGAPWETDLRRTIEQVAKINRIDLGDRLETVTRPTPELPIAARAIPGPSAQDLRNASSLPPTQQHEMAQAMVARLEARLKSNPANPEGWIMLIRSRVTLGEPGKAHQALRDALAANPANAVMIRQQAVLLGVH